MRRRPPFLWTVAAVAAMFAIDYAALALGLPPDGALWVGFGVLIAGVALLGPRWHGDRPLAAPFVLALAGVFLFLGLCTDVRFSRRARSVPAWAPPR